MNPSPDALGKMIREMRLAKDMTQGELGRLAGYGAGAAVSISRVENGGTRPGPERLARLASALGCTADQLEIETARRADGLLDSSGALEVGNNADRGEERPKDRGRRIQREIEHRTAVISELGNNFNEAHDRARDEFFMRFVAIANELTGAPQPDPEGLEDKDVMDAESEAAFRLRLTSQGVGNMLVGGAGGAAAGAAVGSAAAYGTFMAAVSFGTASTGAAISGLSGVAATNAALALLGGGTLAAGGAGVAGGTLLLTGLVAAPAAVFALGGLVWMARRNRKQQEELAEQLDQAESQMAATRPGFEALVEILPRATIALDYIAIHASHALKRWEMELGPPPLQWGSLEETQQQRYRDFIEVAGSQIAVVTINVHALMDSSDDEREQLIELAGETLTQAQAKVESLV